LTIRDGGGAQQCRGVIITRSLSCASCDGVADSQWSNSAAAASDMKGASVITDFGSASVSGGDVNFVCCRSTDGSRRTCFRRVGCCNERAVDAVDTQGRDRGIGCSVVVQSGRVVEGLAGGGGAKCSSGLLGRAVEEVHLIATCTEADPRRTDVGADL